MSEFPGYEDEPEHFDGTLDVPVCQDECDSSDQELDDMNENDYSALKMHCLNGAQAQADSARLFAETLRLDHLEQRRVMDAQEAQASRTYNGPYPVSGSPQG